MEKPKILYCIKPVPSETGDVLFKCFVSNLSRQDYLSSGVKDGEGTEHCVVCITEHNWREIRYSQGGLRLSFAIYKPVDDVIQFMSGIELVQTADGSGMYVYGTHVPDNGDSIVATGEQVALSLGIKYYPRTFKAEAALEESLTAYVPRQHETVSSRSSSRGKHRVH